MFPAIFKAESCRDYFEEEKILLLCKRTDMPDAVIGEILKNAKKFFLSPPEKLFSSLLSDNAAKCSTELSDRLQNDKDGLQILTLMLGCAVCAKEEYERRKIPNEVFYAGMSVFSRGVRDYFSRFQRYGFDLQTWAHRHINLKIFRLSDFQWEITKYSDKVLPEAGFAKFADDILSLHILKGADLSRENIFRSAARAKEFFKTHFPEYSFANIYCRSWLLSPKLVPLLNENSEILRFQKLFRIISFDPPDRDFIRFIFPGQSGEYETFPENTSLQKSVKALLLRGENIGIASGILNM